jgi:hypothetical protein
MFWAGACLAQETGFYLGGALGQASYREACHDFDALVGAAGAFNCISKEASAGKAFAGWRFHRYIAAEISYIDYGEAKGQGSVGGATVNATVHTKAAGVSGLGILPLGDSFSAYGRLGLLRTRTASSASGAVTANSEHDQTELHVGIGGMVLLGRGWSLRGEFERANDSKVDLGSLGVQYQF